MTSSSSSRFTGDPPIIDDAELVSVWDETPLWSAAFGMALLDAVDLRPSIAALDVGCRAGFPLIELAQRLGRSSHVHGVDPGFAVLRITEERFSMRFADATAMFDHFFMRLAFVPPWLAVVAPSEREPIFTELEARLNARASKEGCLALTIPFACFDCRRR
jgi:hypothetical protein